MSDTPENALQGPEFAAFSGDIATLLEEARRQSARSINAILTATYWEIGRRIVEFEQRGQDQAEYGERVIAQLAQELTARFGRGFGWRNLYQMRAFYLAYPPSVISATLSRNAPQILQTVSAKFDLATLATVFPLSWSHYVRLISVREEYARRFYETEALRGGWSLRQLERQINSLFYERTALSRNKAALLTRGAAPKPADSMTAEEEVKDPYVLEFLGLKDEYSESDLEGGAHPSSGEFPARTGQRFHLCGSAEAYRHRRRLVSDGLALLSSPSTLSGHY